MWGWNLFHKGVKPRGKHAHLHKYVYRYIHVVLKDSQHRSSDDLLMIYKIIIFTYVRGKNEMSIIVLIKSINNRVRDYIFCKQIWSEIKVMIEWIFIAILFYAISVIVPKWIKMQPFFNVLLMCTINLTQREFGIVWNIYSLSTIVSFDCGAIRYFVLISRYSSKLHDRRER